MTQPAGQTSGWAERTAIDGSPVWVERPLEGMALTVYWAPRKGIANRYPAGWNVWRGTTPQIVPNAPGVTKLNSTLVQVPMFTDATALTDRNDHLYYLVTEVSRAGDEEPLSGAVTLGQMFGGVDRPTRSPVRIYREFARRKNLLLGLGGMGAGTAEIMDFLIRRRAGDRCAKCFNAGYESTALSECTVCYGVGFERGYELLRSVSCRYLTAKEALKLQPQGLVFSSRPRAWLVNYPIVRNGDVIVRRNGDRYEIDAGDFVSHQGVLTEQNFELVKLPETHPIYLYDIPASAVAAT